MKGFKLQDEAQEDNLYSTIIPRGGEYPFKVDQIIRTDGEFKTNRLQLFQ